MVKLIFAYRITVLLLLGYIAVQLTYTTEVAEENRSDLYNTSRDIASLSYSLENELRAISREICSSEKTIVHAVEDSVSLYSCGGEVGTAIQKIKDVQETLDEIKASVNDLSN